MLGDAYGEYCAKSQSAMRAIRYKVLLLVSFLNVIRVVAIRYACNKI